MNYVYSIHRPVCHLTYPRLCIQHGAKSAVWVDTFLPAYSKKAEVGLLHVSMQHDKTGELHYLHNVTSQRMGNYN